MPISEIGLLKLKSSKSVDDADLRARMNEITVGLQAFTGYPFYFLQQVKDPSFIYLLGEWESLDQHYKGLHGLPDFKQLVLTMSQFFEFQWMAHYDFKMDEADLNAELLEVARFTMDQSRRAEFATKAGLVVQKLDDHLGKNKTVTGWKVDQQREKEEFVVLVPWKDAQQRIEVGETEAGVEYGKLNDFSEEVEIQHIRLLKDL
ncbi:hypothetical protein QQS21_004689 [Conoideocrella luteorostrata]|uniref:ABM domain-containing protein n=1 Tax=Conoideocrella luteorostrata TaxID=1105319 RepID=A0AAJ0CTE9_9HYPO|nr:hypothetical protein QQS21_004689 [Conoideocrella luteorostrata]